MVLGIRGDTMPGIINWNELWKLMRLSSSLRRTLDEDAGSRGDKYAKQCNESLMQSQSKERAERQIAKMELNPDYTVLDIGSGPGRLAILIAKKVKNVTAIDPSRAMLVYLQENMEKEDVKNITCINKRWEDIELGVDIMPHDVVIASGSLVMLDIQEALAKIDAAARRYVYLFISAGKGMDKGLWKVIYGETPSADYIYLYNILHDTGIYANVEISDSEIEQRYNSLDEAVNKWKKMYDLPSEKEGVLREYLSKMLVKDEIDGKLCLKRKSKSAMIWWKKEKMGEGENSNARSKN
jgi:SAM-dependent methyltransferase